MMYRVLIADDEPSVTDSLKNSIQWEELGLEVVGVVGNGIQAIEKIEKESVDIAILDIRMPGMSGLEICEYLHRIKEDLQIIIISGYAEFSYAERAIRYGVLGYCLKPLEYDQITRLLLKAQKNCEKKRQKPQELEFLEALERNDTEEICKRLDKAGLLGKEFYVTVSVGGGIIPFEKRDSIFVELGREQYGYLSKMPPERSVLKNAVMHSGILGIGYSSQSVITKQAVTAINKCVTKAFQYFVNPNQCICEKIDEYSENLVLEKLGKLIANGRWKAVREELKNLETKGWEQFTIRSALKICNMVHSGNLFLEEENDYYIYSIRQLTSEYHNIRHMFACLQQDIESAEEHKGKPLEYTNAAFMELMAYIDENYKKDISLSSAAQNCHMNANYVSQLFKKETGITFVHYITQLRMKEAIKLLETTRKTTAEISTLVGYNDYFYFLKSFKKYTGKTFSQYRAEI